MKFEIMYNENTQLWKMEKLLTAAGYRKTGDCHWVQIYENRNGDSVVTQREDTSVCIADPVDRLTRYLDPQPAQPEEPAPVEEPAAQPAQPAQKPARVSISPGNNKMGAIPSVSLPPVITCPRGVPCAAKCYAAKLCRLRPTVREAYARNLEVLRTDPAEYWRQVRFAASVARYFRFHVSGDIPGADYLAEMIATAEALPGTDFLAFTKNYTVVNAWIDNGGQLPGNLHLIFSEWGGAEIPNPHNLPTAAVIFKGEEPREGWKVCGGNCTECACRGVGCWELKSGETIAFYEH